MKRSIELLAPGGDLNAVKAAIAAGADAVYLGLQRFNARQRAANIRFEDLNGILRLAHKNQCRVYLTLNIIFIESEIAALVQLLNRLVNTSIDGIIAQDLGLLYLLSRHFPGLPIHASTQLTTHNKGQIRFLSRLNAARVNLSRELNIREIQALTSIAHECNLSTEIFVHGSHCLSFSGLCYFSSVQSGTSGNRGRCSQPCRDKYITTPEGRDYPLNLKDNSAFSYLSEIADAGADAIKIEGRIKQFYYVYAVVDAWRKHLQSFFDGNAAGAGKRCLYKAFNRGFSNGYLEGNIHKDMFTDYPRDNSALHLADVYGGATRENLEKAKEDLSRERIEISAQVKSIIDHYSTAGDPLTIRISGKCGSPLKVSVKTPDASFDLFSDSCLETSGQTPLDREMILKRLKAVNETEYHLKHLDMENLQNGLSIPFKELTSIKNRLLFILNGSKAFAAPVDVPLLKSRKGAPVKPALSVIISSQKDLSFCGGTPADMYYRLPESFKSACAEFMGIFQSVPGLMPWFPPILISEDYDAAVEFLRKVRPGRIVTENTGIAWEACQTGIPWIAGPSLNIVNSFSLLCLREYFNCSGAYISSEISMHQIKRIKPPDGFKLFYSLYHPLTLMTARQCLFHQVTGCEKDIMDGTCLPQCEKSASITNIKDASFILGKSKGSYHRIYNERNFLNTDIVADIPDLFSVFSIDLRDIPTETRVEKDKPGIIRLFQNLLNGNPEAEKEIQRIILPSTNTQYHKGI